MNQSLYFIGCLRPVDRILNGRIEILDAETQTVESEGCEFADSLLVDGSWVDFDRKLPNVNALLSLLIRSASCCRSR